MLQYFYDSVGEYMSSFDVELVGKIGSMALINKEYSDINYNIFARISKELRPGYIWVSSGATEIGRLDYLKRAGKELTGNIDEIKTDYASQGQAILMQNYRRFVDPKYSIRQVLVEHQHFNNEAKRSQLKDMLIRCKEQNAIPIINYNDAVSFEENRKLEIQLLQKSKDKVVECADNDETAAQIACLVNAKNLVVLTNVDGIYADANNPETLIKEISGKNDIELVEAIEECKKMCQGASRSGANGAKSKLEYIKEAAIKGTVVYIANSKYYLKDILEGNCKRTVVRIR